MNAKQIKAVKAEIKCVKSIIKYIESMEFDASTECDNDSELGQAINEVSSFIGLLDELEDLA